MVRPHSHPPFTNGVYALGTPADGSQKDLKASIGQMCAGVSEANVRDARTKLWPRLEALIGARKRATISKVCILHAGFEGH